MTMMIDTATATDDPLAALRNMSYDELVARGLECTEGEDAMRWRLGACAAACEVIYGQKSVKKYAGDVRRAISTVYEYRDVFQTFSAARNFDAFRERHQALSWTHYRKAFRHMQATGLPLARAMEILALADDNRWKPEMLQAELIRETRWRKGKPDAPRLKRVCRDVPCEILENNGVNRLVLYFETSRGECPQLPEQAKVFVTFSQAITEDGTPILKSVPATAGPAITRPEFPIVEDETP